MTPAAARPPVTVTRSRAVPPGAAAWVPWPRRILWRPTTRPYVGLMAHELQHVLQAERYGAAWPLVYAAQWARVGFRYRAMPFEIEARRAEGDAEMRLWASDVLKEAGPWP